MCVRVECYLIVQIADTSILPLDTSVLRGLDYRAQSSNPRELPLMANLSYGCCSCCCCCHDDDDDVGGDGCLLFVVVDLSLSLWCVFRGLFSPPFELLK